MKVIVTINAISVTLEGMQLMNSRGNLFHYDITIKSASFVLAFFLILSNGDTVSAQEMPTSQSIEVEAVVISPEISAKPKPEGQAMSASQSGVSGTEGGTAYIYDVGLNAGESQVNVLGGSMQYSYPLKVPLGRNNLTPQLILNYDSNNAINNNIFGYGWNISIPSIKRINRSGTQNLYTSYIFESTLDGELLKTSTTTFVPKVENGSFRKYDFTNNVWTITEKNGTRFFFGTTTQAQQSNPSDNTKIFAWMLEEVRDTNDNFISYAYFKDAGEIYPNQITYTSNGTTTGIFTVTFGRESRPDPIRSYAMGFTATTTYRTTDITANINGTWVRKYALTYASGHNGSRSILNTITESGMDENLVTTTLPATSFAYENYTSPNKAWDNNTASWSIPEDFIRGYQNYDDGVRQVDINGDGLVDLIRFWDANLYTGFGYVPQQRAYLHTGTGWASTSNWTLPQPLSNQMAFTGYEPVSGATTIDLGARFADVNGDGYTDILWGYRTNLSGSGNGYNIDIPYVYLNNKVNGWSTSTIYQLPSDIRFIEQNKSGGIEIADINGDGLPDLLKSTKFTNTPVVTYTKSVYFNTGSGWQQASSTWDIPEPFIDQTEDAGTQVADINGDGLADIIRYIDNDSGNPVIRKTYLNNGAGWSEAGANWQSPLGFAYKFGSYGVKSLSTKIIDINGDGLLDLFNYNTATFVATNTVYINNGSGWTIDTAWGGQIPTMFSYTNNGLWFADLGVRFFDVDGDNMLDFVKSGPTNTYPSGSQEQKVLTHKGNVPDLLTKITQPEGGTVSAAYLQSALYKDANGNRINTSLPYILNTVSTTTYDNLLSTPYTNTFSYAGGSHYYASTTDKQFAGFASTTVIDGFGNKTVTYTHQGNATTSSEEYADRRSKIGKVYRTDILDSLGNVYKRLLSKWDHNASSTVSEFVFKSRDLVRDYDGDADVKDTGTEYSYNTSNGNLTVQTEWGEVTGSTTGSFTDIGTDKRTTQYAYATNTTAYITGLPSQELILNQSNITVRHTRYYYDTLSLGSTTKGNRTKDEQLITGSTYIDTEKTYNNYGLVTQSKDQRDKATNYIYDAYNLYPATTTNPLSQSTKTTYDYSLGKINSVIDPNGSVTTLGYDGLDRVLEEKISDPQTGSLVTKTTNTYTDTLGAKSVFTKQYLSAAKSVDLYEYSDGFGKKRQSRLETEDPNKYAVRDFTYGPEGLTIKESLPYLSSGTTYSSATTSPQLFTNYGYDSLKRIKSVATAVGTTTTTYDQWIDSMTDTNGKLRTFNYDAYRRLGTTTEQLATSTYTTVYAWDQNNGLTKVTDALGNIRNFTYDNVGRRKTAEDLRGTSDTSYGTWTYNYDATGNIASTSDPKAQVVNYTYDDLNRPLIEDFVGQAGTEVTHVYDTCTNGKGRICQSTNGFATTTYLYAINGLPATTSKTISGSVPVRSFATRYDWQGNKTALKYPDTSEIEFMYNNAGLLNSIQYREPGGNWTNIIANFDYGPHGFVTYQLHGDGTHTAKVYDSNELYRLRTILTIATSTLGSGGGGAELMLLETALGLNNSLKIQFELPRTEAKEPLVTEEALVLDIGVIDEILTKTEELVSTSTQIIEKVLSKVVESPIEEQVITSEQSLNSGSTSILETFASTSITEVTPELRDLATTSTTTSEILPQKTKHEIKEARLSLLLEGKSREERVDLKSQELAALTFVEPFSIPGSGVRVEIAEISLIEGGIQVFVRAWRGNKPLGFGKTGDVEIERIRIINPPILVRRGEELIENPEEALKESLTHIISIIGKQDTSIKVGKVGNTTTTVYPDAGTGGVTVDGRMFEDRYISWSTTITTSSCRITGPSDTATDITNTLGNGNGPSAYSNNRIHFGFNTASIPDIDDIISANLSMYGAGPDYSVGTERRVYIASSSPAFNGDLVTTDYGNIGATSLGVTPNSWNGSGYNTASLNSSGLEYINKSGITNMVARGWYDMNATAPTNSDELYIHLFLADQVGAANDPVLIVEHQPLTPPTSGKNIQKLTYTYDSVGNITKIVDSSETITAATTTYTYDDLYRLKTASTTGASSTPYTRSYSYNAIGNLSSSNVGAFTYAATNHANSHAPTTINGVTHRYDRNGNMASTSAGHLNTWNYRNRLTASQGGGTATTTYLYDVDDSRVKKVAGATTTYYVSSLYEINGGTTTKSIYAGDTLVATIDGNGTATTTYHNHLDHLGSAKAITNDLGVHTQTMDYYPYGAKRVTKGPDKTSREYIGQITDAETNLSYLNARYEDSTRGQFLSEDPVFWEVGMTKDGLAVMLNPQLQNSYSYAGNNPITQKDPTGRYAETAFDAMMFANSVNEFRTNPSVGNGVAVALDGLSLATPIVPAVGGSLIRQGTKGYFDRLSENAIVCRGGTCSADILEKGAERIGKNGELYGVSANAADNIAEDTLVKNLPNSKSYGKYGATTVGRIRQLGGDVIKDVKNGSNKFHSLINGLTSKQLNKLFEVKQNPFKRKQ